MKNNIAVYQGKSGSIELNIDAQAETIWATQAQIEELFNIDQSRVSRHIKNIFDDGEVEAESNMRKTHIANSDKPVKLYSLDVILAVGYRTNSKNAIKFRRWSSQILKGYMLRGVAINQKRLDQLNKILEITSRSEISEVAGVTDVIQSYMVALTWLDEYDKGQLPEIEGKSPEQQLTYDEARTFLDGLDFSRANHNFAKERDKSFEGILATLYQTFDNQELYKSLEEKAANLLYLIIKNHPFYDGNKRSAAALFVYFLAKNKALHNINNNTLTAITLMTALSKPEEKKMMILLIMNFLDSQ